MLRITQKKHIILRFCPSPEFFFQWATTHNHQWNVLNSVPDLHQDADSLFFANPAVEDHISFRQIRGQRHVRADICIRNKIIFLYYFVFIKSNIFQQLNLIFIQTDISVNLLVKALPHSVICKNTRHNKALQPAPFEASVFAHAKIVSITAPIAKFSAS